MDENNKNKQTNKNIFKKVSQIACIGNKNMI